MQHRYIGDIGDFGKYGLLHALCAPTDGNPTLSLGIIWYLTCPNQKELTKGDGKHRCYLDKPQEYQYYDQKLFDKLRSFKKDDPSRRISVIPSLGIFPSTTVYYDSVLSLSKLPRIGHIARDTRLKHRRDWFQEAMKATCEADVVFLDPDNGLQINSVQPYHDNGPKYVSNKEFSTLLKCDDKSLVLYQHRWHKGTLKDQYQQQFGKYCGNRHPFVFLYHGGAQRLFIMFPSHRHQDILLERAEQFVRRWKGLFESQVYRIT